MPRLHPSHDPPQTVPASSIQRPYVRRSPVRIELPPVATGVYFLSQAKTLGGTSASRRAIPQTPPLALAKHPSLPTPSFSATMLSQIRKGPDCHERTFAHATASTPQPLMTIGCLGLHLRQGRHLAASGRVQGSSWNLRSLAQEVGCVSSSFSATMSLSHQAAVSPCGRRRSH
jgi:hypothetical protein